MDRSEFYVGLLVWLVRFLPPHPFELLLFLIRQERAASLVALGPLILSSHLGLELRALADRALTRVVAERLIDCHVVPLCGPWL